MTSSITVYDFYDQVITSAETIIGCQNLAAELLAKTPDPKVASKRLVRLTAERSSWMSVVNLFKGQTYIPMASILSPLETFGTPGLQLRMALTIALLAGHDSLDEEVKTFLAKYLGVSTIYGVLRPCATQFGLKTATHLISSIPGRALITANKPVGHRAITKNGRTGDINLMALACVGGMAANAAIDISSTYTIGYAAIHAFFDCDSLTVIAKEVEAEG